MSDTPTDAAPEADADAPAPTDAPDDKAADPKPPSDAPEGDKPATDAAPAEDNAEPPKQSQPDRRFARVTAMLASEKAAREEAERRAAAAEALLNPDAKKDAPAPKATQAEIQAAARQLVAEQTFAQSVQSLIAEGTKEHGAAAWNDKTNVIGQLGAYENTAFMQALVEIPGAHRVVMALADDADHLAVLLDKSPVAMAAELGRMAAELNVAPKPKQVSNAPRPVSAGVGRTQAMPDIYDTKNLTTEEWMALRTKTAPRHLGGEGKGT